MNKVKQHVLDVLDMFYITYMGIQVSILVSPV